MIGHEKIIGCLCWTLAYYRPKSAIKTTRIHFWSLFRTMLCIARTVLSQDVCPSVCLFLYPSVIRRYSVDTAKHILRLFPPSGSHTILVLFLHQTLWQYSDGYAVTRASNPRGMKKLRFSTNISLYLGNDTS